MLVNILCLFLFLSVVGVRSVFTVIMLLDEQRIHCGSGVYHKGHESHFGTLLHHFGIVNGIGRTRTPTAWAVIFYQYARCVVGVNPFKPFNDNIAGFNSYCPSTSAFVMSEVQGIASWK